MTHARRGTAAAHAAVVLGVLVGALVPLLVAAPAAEAASYRYWTYWWGQPAATSWTFAQLGPATDRPKDGAVLGWRFAVTTETGGKKAPRASLPFASLCPTLTTAPEGQKRVAVVVDYGTAADAPAGESPPGGGTVRVECVTVAASANGVTVLNAAGVVLRFGDNGLVCGIDRYPRTECAAIVGDPTPTPKPTTAKPTPAPRPSSASPAGSATTPAASRTTSSSGAIRTPPASPAASSAGASTATASAPPVPSTSDEGSAEAPLPVSSGAPAASSSEDDGGSPVGPIAGTALVAALGIGAWWTARGRRA